MANLIYRDATQQDLSEITAIYNSTIPSRLVTADTEPVSIQSREKWFKEHTPGKRPVWMVETLPGTIVGWVSFQPFRDRPAYHATAEISIYLHEDHRGKGYGKEILEYSIRTVPRYGIKTLLGLIFAHNEPSLKLFYHSGFEDWGILPDIAELDGIQRSLKIVGKRIML